MESLPPLLSLRAAHTWPQSSGAFRLCLAVFLSGPEAGFLEDAGSEESVNWVVWMFSQVLKLQT